MPGRKGMKWRNKKGYSVDTVDRTTGMSLYDRKRAAEKAVKIEAQVNALGKMKKLTYKEVMANRKIAEAKIVAAKVLKTLTNKPKVETPVDPGGYRRAMP